VEDIFKVEGCGPDVVLVDVASMISSLDPDVLGVWT
jgi:hypothetical protein